MVRRRDGLEVHPKELQICLPFQTGRVEGGAIAGRGRRGGEDVESMLIAVGCSSDGEVRRGEGLEGEAGEEALQGSREGEPGVRGGGRAGFGRVWGLWELRLLVGRGGGVGAIGHC